MAQIINKTNLARLLAYPTLTALGGYALRNHAVQALDALRVYDPVVTNAATIVGATAAFAGICILDLIYRNRCR
jgi:hypothetical protein